MGSATFAESTVEDAALEWFERPGYGVLHGPDIIPEQPRAERESYDQVVLPRRLRLAITRLNPDLPPVAWNEAERKLLRRPLRPKCLLHPRSNPEDRALCRAVGRAVQKQWLHTLGNLALTLYNAAMSDRPFLEKRDMQGGFRGLNARQVGQILDGPHVVVRNRKRRRALYLVVGTDYGGACIAVPIEPTHDPLVWRPVTAWRCKDRESALL
jgi:Protein of unknown function (DUF1524)